MVRFERITVDPEQMGGVPCIRGYRVPVAHGSRAGSRRPFKR
ncbi:MAG: DUF433 domain-containing protein [Actinomycetota bacterium]